MKRKLLIITMILALSMVAIIGCTNTDPEVSENKDTQGKYVSGEKVVNLYTDRHYDIDEELYNQFTEETGIKVNVVKGNSDELIERLTREGQDTEADLFMTADVGRLYRAKEKDLLQAATSEVLTSNIPENLRDTDNTWYGLTIRGRIIVYAKDRVNPSELSTYADLTNPKWKGKVLVRSSENIYNQSLLASFIAINGEEEAKEWAKGIVENMAREPKGNDRDQATDKELNISPKNFILRIFL